ncbi:hypothetical protein ACVWXN_007177 [Bradyrhizobium sp. i1.4.4]
MRYLEVKKGRIEIIPMIDIMLFLLVFFIMITLRMIPATGIASQLPQSSTAQDLPHPKIVVTMFADGAIETDGQKLTIDDLTAKLAAEPDREHAARYHCWSWHRHAPESSRSDGCVPQSRHCPGGARREGSQVGVQSL